MNTRVSMLFKKFLYINQSLQNLMMLLKENKYSKEKGEGFKINELNDSQIFASYIYQFPSFISIFDENSLEFKREKTILTNIVNFTIDIPNQILIIYANISSSRRLLTEIGKITNFQFPIEDITFSPLTIIPKFNQANIQLKITSLRIRNFKVNPNISGTFWIKIIEPTIAKDLIENYSGEVIYLGASTDIQNSNINLGFYENGTLILSVPDEDFETILETIKRTLFLER